MINMKNKILVVKPIKNYFLKYLLMAITQSAVLEVVTVICRTYDQYNNKNLIDIKNKI
jgi:hypothetical protein